MKVQIRKDIFSYDTRESHNYWELEQELKKVYHEGQIIEMSLEEAHVLRWQGKAKMLPRNLCERCKIFLLELKTVIEGCPSRIFHPMRTKKKAVDLERVSAGADSV